MADCIFCKIVTGEVASERVFEDDDTLAFLDIAPVNPGHTLLIPKQHFATLFDTSSSALSALVRVLPRVARALTKAVSAAGLNVGMNNGAAAGQIVPHVHLQLIPRFPHDGYQSWGHRSYAAGEAARVAEQIRAALE